MGHIHTVITHYALAYPATRFHLTADGRPAFQSTGNGSLNDVLIAVHGLEVAEQMLEVQRAGEPEESQQVGSPVSLDPSHPSPSSSPVVFGYISVPALHRANRNYISFFVNRRRIQDRSLGHAVAEAYHTLLPTGRHPVALIFLEMDPTDVDVNVHPTKREVKFRNGRQVFGTVQRAVRRTLVERAPVSALLHTSRTWPAPEWEHYRSLLPFEQGETQSTQTAMELYRPGDLGQEPQPVGPVRLPLLRVVGQVGQTYIVAEGPQGMYLIDQHAAHERILYEQLMAAHGQKTISSQKLLEPLPLNLDPMLAGVLTEHLAKLTQVGFDLEPFGGTTYLLRSVPSILVVPK
jgi:DNA mismatch repair protein MutL